MTASAGTDDLVLAGVAALEPAFYAPDRLIAQGCAAAMAGLTGGPEGHFSVMRTI
jgi:hypothetical protein